MIGTVIEDRGNVGVGGRHLLRVRLELTAGAEPLDFEIPANHVKIVAKGRTA